VSPHGPLIAGHEGLDLRQSGTRERELGIGNGWMRMDKGRDSHVNLRSSLYVIAIAAMGE
jgi:hypothetical protein